MSKLLGISFTEDFRIEEKRSCTLEARLQFEWSYPWSLRSKQYLIVLSSKCFIKWPKSLCWNSQHSIRFYDVSSWLMQIEWLAIDFEGVRLVNEVASLWHCVWLKGFFINDEVLRQGLVQLLSKLGKSHLVRKEWIVMHFEMRPILNHFNFYVFRYFWNKLKIFSNHDWLYLFKILLNFI